MVPLFKSHYSIGRSVLRTEEIFNLSKQHNLSKVFLVEDSLIGFLEADKESKDKDIDLVFGLRIDACHTVSENKKDNEKCFHKIIIFAKNGKGCKLINQIYSKAFCENSGAIDFPSLKALWDKDSLLLAIPFYDSFIFKNTLHFCSCVPDFSFCNPIFFLENNFLPFDQIIRDKVIEYCSTNDYSMEESKSIFYENREDFSAFQTYKCICSRRFKQRTLSVPNFDHLASPEFCLESFLEHEVS
tara:strand:- start:22 stop:750 length:729 start_codon:yes stop_codon:yes gene_type:complete